MFEFLEISELTAVDILTIASLGVTVVGLLVTLYFGFESSNAIRDTQTLVKQTHCLGTAAAKETQSLVNRTFVETAKSLSHLRRQKDVDAAATRRIIHLITGGSGEFG